jgi:hypothetical protein
MNQNKSGVENEILNNTIIVENQEIKFDLNLTT